MENKKTSVFANGLIWFGAAVSIAEIMAGSSFASLGILKGTLAIVIGHIIGCLLLYLAGLIGAKTEKSSMETVKISFGKKGSLLFSVLNILQLVGWTAVMIASGASASGQIALAGFEWIYSIVIGVLILILVLIGIKNLGKINTVAMGALFILTILLSVVVFSGDIKMYSLGEGLSFGAAVELSIAMPLSWLPLISDYTRQADKPKASTAISAVTYFFTSCWMYIIGMGATMLTGESDIARIMLSAGLGIVGLVVIILSTVTTTFLDVYSAGISAESVSHKLKGKTVAVIVCVIGTLLAIFLPITEQLESFLYLIGSVFAPMIAIMLVDVFLLKLDSSEKRFDIVNLILWLVGFIIYRLFMQIDIIVGCTIPSMVIIAVISYVVHTLMKKLKKS